MLVKESKHNSKVNEGVKECIKKLQVIKRKHGIKLYLLTQPLDSLYKHRSNTGLKINGLRSRKDKKRGFYQINALQPTTHGLSSISTTILLKQRAH
jgi:hypothetical protein